MSPATAAVRGCPPAFAGVTDPLALWVAPDDAHPNAQAHAIIARAVAPFLSGNQ